MKSKNGKKKSILLADLPAPQIYGKFMSRLFHQS